MLYFARWRLMMIQVESRTIIVFDGQQHSQDAARAGRREKIEERLA
jgi:hypothetical protein